MKFKKRVLCGVGISLVFTCFSYDKKSGITYMLSTGRFGEHLTSYIKAKYLAEKYGLTFLYKPFVCTNELVLHTTDEVYQAREVNKRFKNVVNVYNEQSGNITKDSQVLYVVFWSTGINGCKDPFMINDNYEPAFVEKMRKVIAFKDKQRNSTIASCSTPSDGISVAVHIRKGGGYDTKDVIEEHKLLFPTDDFYTEQLKRIAKLFPEKNIYVHIFTDDPNPAALADSLREALKNQRFKFVYRSKGNKHDANILEDFFAMSRCECLIRPKSGYSQLAQLIGHHKIVIAPWETQMNSRKTNIGSVMMTTNYGGKNQTERLPVICT